METLHTETIGDVIIQIVQDLEPENPRDWDNFGTMVCWHQKYTLGDKQKKGITVKETEELLMDGGHIYLPLYLFDHSGLCMRTTPFSCPWDSGQVGWIYASKETAINEFGDPESDGEKLVISPEVMVLAVARLKKEVETYSAFLQGQVYGYHAIRKVKCPTCGYERKDSLSSCYGYYDYNACLADAKISAKENTNVRETA